MIARQGVYCVLSTGSKHARTPSAQDLDRIGWHAVQFEFPIHDASATLSVQFCHTMDVGCLQESLQVALHAELDASDGMSSMAEVFI